MIPYRTLTLFVISVFALTVAACNIPGVATPDGIATSIAATISFLHSPSALPPDPQVPTSSLIPTSTTVPTQTPIPQNPIVIKDALCSLGPGDSYEVVSSIKSGTRLELLGKGDVPGWWIVRNPLYHDPCWIADPYIQIDPNTNLSLLQIFVSPPTPTVTPFPITTP